MVTNSKIYKAQKVKEIMKARPQIEDKRRNEFRARYEHLKSQLLVFLTDRMKVLNSIWSIIIVGFVYEAMQGS